MPSNNVVHLIDDDEALRDSLSFLLSSAQFEVRTYETALMFLEALPRAEPGCIITDVRMPGMSGVDLLRRLNALQATYPVIVITGHGDVPLAVEAMKLGAVEFLEKPFEDGILISAIRAAMNRHERHTQRLAEISDVLARVATLSNRERQVLGGLVAGHPNKTIAFDLGISPRTVEIYRANVMTKMQASSLSDLVRMAVLAGFIDNPAESDRAMRP
jgi:two-component system response regulator FixJ